MKEPTFDADGYPTQETLDAIKEWPVNDPEGWFDFVEDAWTYNDSFRRTFRGRHIEAATGGWSGNESLIGAMAENGIIWAVCWQSSHRGGLYVFDIPENLCHAQS